MDTKMFKDRFREGDEVEWMGESGRVVDNNIITRVMTVNFKNGLIQTFNLHGYYPAGLPESSFGQPLKLIRRMPRSVEFECGFRWHPQFGLKMERFSPWPKCADEIENLKNSEGRRWRVRCEQVSDGN